MYFWSHLSQPHSLVVGHNLYYRGRFLTLRAHALLEEVMWKMQSKLTKLTDMTDVFSVSVVTDTQSSTSFVELP
jgi:hypothetical protein